MKKLGIAIVGSFAALYTGKYLLPVKQEDYTMSRMAKLP